MKSAELLVKCLETEGVKYIFGVPGEENLRFLEAVRTSNIKFIVTRHEQAAVFMAATYGRLTGRAGVALSTLGPGATNLVTGVAYATLGGMPLLVITGQKPIRKSKQGKFQIIDVVCLMQPITKMATTIIGGEKIPSLVREAFKFAEGERPGAVHLELPEDIAEDEVSELPYERLLVRRPGPDPKAIDQAVEMLNTASHPLVLIAAGANRKLVSKHLKTFLDKTGIPFITTQMGKGVEDERSEQYLGTTALSSGDYVHSALQAADVVLVVGHDVTEKPPIIMTPETHKAIHVNFYEASIDDVYVPSLEVVGDIAHTLWSLAEKLDKNPKWDFEYFNRVKELANKQINERSDGESFPVKPQRLVHDLREALPHDGILALDNGMYKIWLARNYKAYEANTILLDNALATMGAGLPSGIAAKLIFPERKVVVVAGDGGIMMNISEIETAVRLSLDIVIVVLTDEKYGMIKWKQNQMNLPDFGLDFKNPDFVLLAESFGAKGLRVSNTLEFSQILNKCLNSKGVFIIDCPIDYSENVLVFDQELKDKTCNI